MELHTKAIDIDLVRTDGGTQVREVSFDEEYVAELATIYEENRGSEIPPIIVFFDGESYWLADGFNRTEAQRRAGVESVLADVRRGTLEMAKFFAAGSNIKNGLRRTPGDKKRAILLARATAKGAAMGVRELARHCGCDHALVSRTLSGDTSPTDNSFPVPVVETKRVRIEAAIRASPQKSNAEIAGEVGSHRTAVHAVRKEIGAPNPPRGVRKHESTEEIEAHLRSGELTHKQIAEATGASTKTVCEKAKRLGLTGSREERAAKVNAMTNRMNVVPSAPEQHEKDRRSKAEVLRARPNTQAAKEEAEAQEAIIDLIEESLSQEGRWNLAVALQRKWPGQFGLSNRPSFSEHH